MDNQIRVNMTPNHLDLKTLHCSQGDTEARTFKFELHNNGETVDVSGVREQIAFKAYKDGTEEIQPVNGSVPVTSPFKGDIKYPQGLLTDQEFTYRESPTEEDGLAKITDIKGNTIVWNQLAQLNQGVANTCTKSYDDTTTIMTITPTSYESNNVGLWNLVAVSNLKNGHKYYISIEVKPDFDVSVTFGFGPNVITGSLTSGKFQTVRAILTWTASSLTIYARLSASGWSSGTFQIKNVQCIDLTQMGLDSVTVEEFTSLFPLSYYSYNQGSLLSFNGNGIKTTGKNLLETATSGTVSGVAFTVNNDGSITVNGTATSNGPYYFYRNTSVLPSWAKLGQTYTLSLTNPINGFDILSFDSSGTYRSLASLSTIASQAFTIPNDAVGLLIRIFVTSGVTYDVTVYPQIEIGTSATSYEPYTSSTLSLPISTYFPTGMKSAGSVYDELTETKAINRLIKTVVDGTNKTANYYGTFQGHQLFYIDLFATTYVNVSNMTNLKSNHYLTAGSAKMDDRYIRYQTVAYPNINIGRIYWNDDRYTSASAMNTALQSSPLEIVSLAQSETVETFSVASLVTENTEIPLSNEDGVLIGKCTEQLSENPGFIDAKIKLSDGDGECYSNKIQLHVERSPQ